MNTEKQNLPLRMPLMLVISNLITLPQFDINCTLLKISIFCDTQNKCKISIGLVLLFSDKINNTHAYRDYFAISQLRIAL